MVSSQGWDAEAGREEEQQKNLTFFLILFCRLLYEQERHRHKRIQVLIKFVPKWIKTKFYVFPSGTVLNSIPFQVDQQFNKFFFSGSKDY